MDIVVRFSVENSNIILVFLPLAIGESDRNPLVSRDNPENGLCQNYSALNLYPTILTPEFIHLEKCDLGNPKEVTECRPKLLQ